MESMDYNECLVAVRQLTSKIESCMGKIREIIKNTSIIGNAETVLSVNY